MTERLEELSEEFADQQSEAMLAEGSAIEAIRNGQFDHARAAVDAAEAAWSRQAELQEELVEIVNDGPDPE